ncbi:MarR family transcriptional regulator [Candidatus Pacearchaeota archaeon]|nr:MarR family transcriptional regulator [Candidatus Pacearchaeota archaeon]
MENKYVGYLLIGISILIIAIIFLFSSALKEITASSCSMEKEICPMNQSVNSQTYLSLGIVVLLMIVGFILIFSKPQEKIIVKTRTIEKKFPKKEINTHELKPEEKNVLKLVSDNKAIFQAELIEKTKFGKAKITRILDRLEGKGFVERKRRGMTNIVVMKE